MHLMSLVRTRDTPESQHFVCTYARDISGGFGILLWACIFSMSGMQRCLELRDGGVEIMGLETPLYSVRRIRYIL